MRYYDNIVVNKTISANRNYRVVYLISLGGVKILFGTVLLDIM